ncbi:MAG: epoxyqueuosine reductase QueH [Parasporobacterium sp.]|nr:epoxyqueuosine reductase QueH [Parasporobacterium sp.]
MEQKKNFQKKLDELLETIKESSKTPSLLLHSCCGPCSSYVLDYLKDYFHITVFYYNPNIDPEEEYAHRLSEQKRLIDTVYPGSVELLTLPYDHEEFLSAVKGLEGEPEGGARCEECFRLRLEKTAQLAKEKGFDYYGTTLTVSPHKNAMILNRVGHETEASSGNAVWLESDFKKKNGYLKSIELSKEIDLYRQVYCGCEFARL